MQECKKKHCNQENVPFYLFLSMEIFRPLLRQEVSHFLSIYAFLFLFSPSVVSKAPGFYLLCGPFYVRFTTLLSSPHTRHHLVQAHPSLSSCDLILLDGGSRFLLEVTVRLTTGPPFSSVVRSLLKFFKFLRDILHEPCS